MLGFAFAQESTIVTQPVYAGDKDTWPAYYIGNGKRLTDDEVKSARAKAAELGLDYTTSIDGKYFKFFFDGSDAAAFAGKVNEVKDAAGFKEFTRVETRSTFNEAENYTQVSEPSGASGSGQEVRDYSSWSRRPDLLRRTIDSVLIPYAKLVAGQGYRFSPDRFGEKFGLEEENVEYIRKELRPKNGKALSTAKILNGEEELSVARKSSSGKASVTELLNALQNRAGKVGLIDPADRSDEALSIIADAVTDEIINHVMNGQGATAIGWYDQALKKAKGIYYEIFPSLRTDPNKEMMFDAFLGVTSQGNDVFSNSLYASRIFAQFDNGSTITDLVKNLKGTFGKQTNAIEKNLLKLESLIDRNGYDTMRELFNSRKKVGEWNAILRTDPRFETAGDALKVKGLASQEVTGWMVFGPKIGSFINNLHGDYSTLTADLWFSRTWNRLLGYSFLHTPAIEADKFQAFKEAVIAEASRTTEPKKMVKGKPVPWLFGNDVTAEKAEEIINDPQKMLTFAGDLETVFRKGGYKEITDLRRAAKNWIEFRETAEEAPRNDSERDMQQRAMELAQKRIKAESGIDITIADMQAALWYHEKELFGKFGAANSTSDPADYADAATETVATIKDGKLFYVPSTGRNIEVGDIRLSRKALEPTSQLVLMNERLKAKESWGRHLTNDHMRATEGETREVGDLLNNLYLLAAQGKDNFDAFINELADATGTKAKIAPLKKRERTMEKIMSDYNGEVADMKDVLRATIATESLAQARQLFEVLSEVGLITDVKSALKSSLETGTGAGYRDAKVIIDVNGVPAELIIAPESLLIAKDLAHSKYVEQRGLDAKMRATTSESMKAMYRAKIEKLDATMVEIYVPAAQRAQSSSASLREQGSALSRTVSMLNGRLTGSNAKNPEPISATGLPSKSKNLVPSGNSLNGDSIGTSSKYVFYT